MCARASVGDYLFAIFIMLLSPVFPYIKKLCYALLGYNQISTVLFTLFTPVDDDDDDGE